MARAIWQFWSRGPFDDIPSNPPAITVPGDIWLLGPHRLLCGDATSTSDLDKLMELITDALMEATNAERGFLFLRERDSKELTHRAATADVFALGALRAAAWLRDRAPGLYGMRDVLSD